MAGQVICEMNSATPGRKGLQVDLSKISLDNLGGVRASAAHYTFSSQS
jgi:hypothetical protein